MKSMLRRAMMDSETFVVELIYTDSRGNRTRRVVSPIRFVGQDRFLGLCLCREEPRQFQLDRCENVRLIPAAEVIMPMPLETLPAAAPEIAPTAGPAACTPGVSHPCLV